MSVKVKYKGEEILSLNTDGEEALATQGQYCEADIIIENTQDGDVGGDYNIEVVDDGNGGQILNITDAEGGGGVENVEWHQCPTAVKEYLNNVTYNPNDYTTSQIANYAPAVAVQSNTKPIGKTVDGVTFYNEIPNAKTPFATQNKAGTIKPLDRLRWINTPQAQNVRDLGGWACDGGTIKYGKLLRGGEVTTADRNSLVVECGVQHELNLRGNEVAIRDYSVLGEDVRYTQFDQYDWYVGTKPDLWRKIMRVVFDCVKYNSPLYFHCQAGADRTAAVALVIEAILGVSQSDCDKDYELTCFSTGTDTDANARRRNEVSWTTSIERIKAFEGDTFRDKMIAWLTTLGFTAEEINAFRASMIDGNPETISIDVDSYSVSNELTSVTNSNNTDSVDEYQPYEAELIPADGKIINSVQITMGGVDITKRVFTGEKTNFYFGVTKTLTNCTINNNKISVIGGGGYGATITAEEGYSLTEDGASVTITMGGVDVSTQYYSNGRISIPVVTGDIVITATAVQSAPTYENKLLSSIDLNGNVIGATPLYANTRWNSSGGTSEAAGYNTTGLIPVNAGDTVRIRWSGGGNTSYNLAKAFKSDRSQGVNGYASWFIMNRDRPQDIIDWDNDAGIMDFVVPVSNTIPAGTKYLSFTLYGSLANVIITVNEEII